MNDDGDDDDACDNESNIFHNADDVDSDDNDHSDADANSNVKGESTMKLI